MNEQAEQYSVSTFKYDSLIGWNVFSYFASFFVYCEPGKCVLSQVL